MAINETLLFALVLSVIGFALYLRSKIQKYDKKEKDVDEIKTLIKSIKKTVQDQEGFQRASIRSIERAVHDLESSQMKHTSTTELRLESLGEQIKGFKTEKVVVKTILYVEDSESLQLLVRNFIEREMGHICVSASDGLDGLLKFKEYEGEIDCVLVDYHMETLNGAEFISQLNQDLPIAFITADPDGLACRYPAETNGRLIIDKKNFFENMKKLKAFIDEARTNSSKATSRP